MKTSRKTRRYYESESTFDCCSEPKRFEHFSVADPYFLNYQRLRPSEAVHISLTLIAPHFYTKEVEMYV